MFFFECVILSILRYKHKFQHQTCMYFINPTFHRKKNNAICAKINPDMKKDIFFTFAHWNQTKKPQNNSVRKNHPSRQWQHYKFDIIWYIFTDPLIYIYHGVLFRSTKPLLFLSTIRPVFDCGRKYWPPTLFRDSTGCIVGTPGSRGH